MTARMMITTVVTAAIVFTIGSLVPVTMSDEAAPIAGSLEALENEAGTGTATAEDLAVLAMDYLSRVRTEADPTVIPEARRLLERSLRLEPEDNFAASLGMASLANAGHDFSASVRWSRRAIAIDPYDAAPYGTLGDALYELGKVEAADRAYQDMIDRRPDVGAYVRASYSAQAHQRPRAAIHALRLAIEASGPVGEQTAWLHHQLGDVYAGLGRFERSEEVNREGARMAPGYVPPTVGIAESFISRGRYEEAVPIMERAVESLPAVEYLVTLGDLYWILDDRYNAERLYFRAAERLKLYRESGVLPDHDLVSFYADHGYRSDALIGEARSIFGNRPTPAAADTLAWALHSQGRDREAWGYVLRSLRTADVPVATRFFHAAAIADGLGRTGRARRWARSALELDPHFSLFHLETARVLAR